MEDSGDTAALGFAELAEAAAGGWLQGRWHSEEGDSVARVLSFDSVTGANPFEVRPSLAKERRAFAARKKELETLLDLKPLARRAFVSLSNGEMRRVMFARAILKGARRLVLEDPYGGLDPARRAEMRRAIAALRKNGTEVVVRGGGATALPPAARKAAARKSAGCPLASIENATVAFGGRVLFRDLSWTIREGERWLLRGPNGSGKTTLLALLSGDSPLGYACGVTLFGRRRGAEGVTLSGARGKIGFVSPERQLYGGGTPEEQLDAAFAKKPRLLLLDEPCCNLGPAAARRMTRRIADWLDAHPRAAAVCVAHRADDVPRGFSLELALPQTRRAGQST